MSTLAIIVFVLVFGMLIGGIMQLLKSAKKFNLTDEQLKRIKERNKQLDKEEDDKK